MAKASRTEASAHPIIVALEGVKEPVVEISGFLGKSDETTVRLYATLNTERYVDIPKEAIVHLETEDGAGRGAARAFVKSSAMVLSVARMQLTAERFKSEVAALDLPPVRAYSFWTCAAQCEAIFAAAAVQILIDEFLALQDTDPTRQEIRLAIIAGRKHEAKMALHACLEGCLAKHGAPWFMAVPDGAGGFTIERFSLG